MACAGGHMLINRTAALKDGIWNPKTETEYGIRERRFEKNNVSNDKKINDQIKKDISEYIKRVEETASTAVSRELIPVKRLLIPLPAMDANFHGTAKRGEKRH